MPRIVSSPPQHGPGGSNQTTDDSAWYSADTIAEQTRILEEEFRALLAEQSPGTAAPAGTAPADTSVIPGFEALTWADLAEARRIGDLLDRELPTGETPEQPAGPSACPSWCLHTDTHTSEHIGARHTIQVTRGGATLGNPTAPVTISAHLEQTRDIDSDPLVVLTLNIDGADHETYLGVPETETLRSTLGTLLTHT